MDFPYFIMEKSWNFKGSEGAQTLYTFKIGSQILKFECRGIVKPISVAVLLAIRQNCHVLALTNIVK